MTPDQISRAAAALDAWFDDGSVWARPGRAWDQRELESMHAALEAPATDAALEAFPGPPGTWLSTPEQDEQNRALMTELRRLFSRETASGGRCEQTPEADCPFGQATGWQADCGGVKARIVATAARQAGESVSVQSFSVLYRNPGLPNAVVVRTATPERTHGGTFLVEVVTEYLTCNDPADPVGSRTWSDEAYDVLLVRHGQARYWDTAADAEAAARGAASMFSGTLYQVTWNGCQVPAAAIWDDGHPSATALMTLTT